MWLLLSSALINVKEIPLMTSVTQSVTHVHLNQVQEKANQHHRCYCAFKVWRRWHLHRKFHSLSSWMSVHPVRLIKGQESGGGNWGLGLEHESAPSFELRRDEKNRPARQWHRVLSVWMAIVGVVPPSSVIRPLHSFPLSFIRWLRQVMCCEMCVYSRLCVLSGLQRRAGRGEYKQLVSCDV